MPELTIQSSCFFAPGVDPREGSNIGFRFGDKGAHTSRTMMLSELTALMNAVSPSGERGDYLRALLEENVVGKSTSSNRASTARRLSEFYVLDPDKRLFRVLRRCWDADASGRPLIALLASLARDPRLRNTAPVILSMSDNSEFQRDAAKAAVRASAGSQLSDGVLDKLLRNAASTWTQAGFLEGRTFKRRRRVKPTAGSAAFAAWLAYEAGFRGSSIFTSGWFRTLDASAGAGRDMLVEAKRHSLLDFRAAGEVVSLDFSRLDQALETH